MCGLTSCLPQTNIITLIIDSYYTCSFFYESIIRKLEIRNQFKPILQYYDYGKVIISVHTCHKCMYACMYTRLIVVCMIQNWPSLC